MSKTILVTGIGGLTPRSITTIIREKHPDYHIIGCDVEKKAMGFFMTMKDGKKLVDEYYICPRCTDSEYFPWNLKSLNGEITTRRTEDFLVRFSWDVSCFLNL